MNEKDLLAYYVKQWSAPKEISQEKYTVFQNFEKDFIRRFFKKDDILSMRMDVNSFHVAYFSLTVKPMVLQGKKKRDFMEMVSKYDLEVLSGGDDRIIIHVMFDITKD